MARCGGPAWSQRAIAVLVAGVHTYRAGRVFYLCTFTKAIGNRPVVRLREWWQGSFEVSYNIVRFDEGWRALAAMAHFSAAPRQ